jgi:hypothetical protein
MDVGALAGPVTLEPKKLTVLSGGNNTGKTYAMYVLWALQQRRMRSTFSFVEPIAEKLRDEGTVQIPLAEFCRKHWSALEKGIGEGLRKRLPELFSAPPKSFETAQVSVSIDIEAVLDNASKRQEFKRTIEVGSNGKIDVRIGESSEGLSFFITALDVGKIPRALLSELVSSLFVELVLFAECENAFLLPAERGGLNLFYLDLDAKNAAIVRHLKRDESSPFEIIKDLMVAQYAEPIDAYIQFLKRAPRSNKGSGAFHDQALSLQKEITRVRYKVSKDGVITAKPYRSEVELGIHLTSSTVKSFYGLWAWLEMQAKQGDCLMIDEPELNLHPDNQRLVARLLGRLINRGINIVISTHSDYIVRELNNMIMLGTPFTERGKLERKYDYDAEGQERLHADDVAAYHFGEKAVEACTVSSDFGIEIESMDAAINNLNESNSAIYFALSEFKEAQK